MIQLLEFEHPERKKIDSIIEAEEQALCPQLPDEYSTIWDFLTDEEATWSPIFGNDAPKVYTFMKKRLPKAPLLDLGCGRVLGYPGNKTMLSVAERFRLPGYIGIDRYNVGRKENPLDPTVNVLTLDQENFLRDYGINIDVALIRTNMLDFVSRMQPGLYNITINGIDHNILHQPEDYSSALANELRRVCIPGSMIFGTNSEVFYPLSRLAEFKRLEVPDVRIMSPQNRFGWIFERGK